MLALLTVSAAGAPASDLDEFVALAMTRDPLVSALEHDAAAAADRAVASARPMDPRLMLSAQALGAPMTAPGAPMFMVGFSQMLRGPGEAASVRRRLAPGRR